MEEEEEVVFALGKYLFVLGKVALYEHQGEYFSAQMN